MAKKPTAAQIKKKMNRRIGGASTRPTAEKKRIATAHAILKKAKSKSKKAAPKKKTGGTKTVRTMYKTDAGKKKAGISKKIAVKTKTVKINGKTVSKRTMKKKLGNAKAKPSVKKVAKGTADHWFTKLSKEAKAAYLKAHPNSKFAKGGAKKAASVKSVVKKELSKVRKAERKSMDRLAKEHDKIRKQMGKSKPESSVKSIIKAHARIKKYAIKAGLLGKTTAKKAVTKKAAATKQAARKVARKTAKKTK